MPQRAAENMDVYTIGEQWMKTILLAVSWLAFAACSQDPSEPDVSGAVGAEEEESNRPSGPHSAADAGRSRQNERR